jgi:hypothetical protein
MQGEANRVLNALDEGKVLTVITLYDQNALLTEHPGERKKAIESVLKDNLEMSQENIDYWMDWFRVK